MKSSSSREYHHQEENHFEQRQQQTFQTSTTKISETNQVKEFQIQFHNNIKKITILFFFLLHPYIKIITILTTLFKIGIFFSCKKEMIIKCDILQLLILLNNLETK